VCAGPSILTTTGPPSARTPHAGRSVPAVAPRSLAERAGQHSALSSAQDSCSASAPSRIGLLPAARARPGGAVRSFLPPALDGRDPPAGPRAFRSATRERLAPCQALPIERKRGCVIVAFNLPSHPVLSPFPRLRSCYRRAFPNAHQPSSARATMARDRSAPAGRRRSPSRADGDRAGEDRARSVDGQQSRGFLLWLREVREASMSRS